MPYNIIIFEEDGIVGFNDVLDELSAKMIQETEEYLTEQQFKAQRRTK